MSAMVCATPCVVPVAEKYTTSVLPVVVTVLVASEEAAALDAASLEAATDDAAEEATEELLTLLAELPEQEASSRAAADAPATCKNWRREILFFILFICIYPFIWFIFRKKLSAPSYKLLEIYF